VSSAKTWVPFYVAIMSWAFTTYLIVKGIKQVVKVEFINAALIGMLIAAITFVIMRKYLKKKKTLKNDKESIASLFSIPLIFAVALLTFAHGANDVANAIGPMAAIYDTFINGNISSKVDLPIWILALGGFGISFGLAVFGPRIIKTVGVGITELDRIRAFCIALAASITVIIASQLGLPVSSTHIAIGGIFGVGLLREWIYRKERKKGEKYVERSMVKKIVGAWLITVPASALLAGLLFMVLKDIML
ncbi:inorganic phosphate transporter, partial [Candidatus Gracilibacteria bacterium]|nr:inorganic phosphate transporter [Candidatus Gracilibacteria bacterium]